MNVRVTSSLAGNGFTFGWGQVVDADVFAAKVGAGWERKCEPIENASSAATADESTDAKPVGEIATKRRRK